MTSPETVLAASSLGASVIVTLPLIVSLRSEPWTPVTLMPPEIECRSTDTDAGTAMV